MFVLLSVSDKNISGDDIFPMKGIHHLRFSFIILSPHPLLDLQLPQKSVGSEFGDQWTSVDFAYHFKAETGSSLFINKYSLQHDFWGGGTINLSVIHWIFSNSAFFSWSLGKITRPFKTFQAGSCMNSSLMSYVTILNSITITLLWLTIFYMSHWVFNFRLSI